MKLVAKVRLTHEEDAGRKAKEEHEPVNFETENSKASSQEDAEQASTEETNTAETEEKVTTTESETADISLATIEQLTRSY